jgi:hypothetical protein
MTSSKDWSSEYIQLIEDCEQRESKLTDWENTFIDSLKTSIERGLRPTPKQIEV